MYFKKERIVALLTILIIVISGAKAADDTAGRPEHLDYTTGNFWVNYTWSAGANTDSFNVSINGNWSNGSTTLFKNITASPHGWVNISIAGYNSTSGQLSGFEYMSTRIPNNPVTLTNVQSSYLLYEGQTLYIRPGYTDADGDKGTFAATAAKGIFNSSSGVFSWTTKGEDRGVYNWQINVTDGYGSISQWRFTVTVNPIIPGRPKLVYTTGNRWVNYTWSSLPDTDSYNVSINGNWSNGSTALFKNTTVSPHGWVNISVAGYNNASHTLSDFVSTSTQVTDNPITLTNVSDRYFLNEAGTLYISPTYTDADSDTGVFATNAACVADAKCTFNPSTGVLSWTIGPENSGIYNWYINVTDRYGSVSTQDFKVIIPLDHMINFIQPSIVNDSEQWVDARVGHVGKLIGVNATFKNTGEESLVLMITEIYNNTRNDLSSSIPPLAINKSFSYRKVFEINSTEVKGGLFNFTFEIEAKGSNGREFTYRYTNTTTISLPVIPIYKMKRANADAVLVSQGRNTPPIIYTLEANSSVNLINVSIYDPFYPDKYFNISKLEANKPRSINYTYQATTNDLSSKKCDEPFPYCIINQATFTGRIESSGKLISDTDYVEILVGSISSPASSSRGGGGSGGGGGGIPPSEDYNNIEKRELREMDVLSRTSSVYTFKSVDPVMVVSFESSTSENGIAVAVEILKNRSKHAGTDAPGKLYKYFNVYAGTSGFGKKVSNGVVAYSVNNSWLEKNGLDPEDIRMYKWQGSWVEKDTDIVERRRNQTYYASLVGNFSSFAIAGLKKPEVISVSPLMNNSLNESNATQSANSGSGPTVGLNLILLMLAIVGIVSGYYYFKKK